MHAEQADVQRQSKVPHKCRPVPKSDYCRNALRRITLRLQLAGSPRRLHGELLCDHRVLFTPELRQLSRPLNAISRGPAWQVGTPQVDEPQAQSSRCR